MSTKKSRVERVREARAKHRAERQVCFTCDIPAEKCNGNYPKCPKCKKIQTQQEDKQ